MLDLLQSLIWQQNDAERIESLIQQKQDWYTGNQTEFWQDWYDNVFNLQTANEFGCAVWSIILDILISTDATATRYQSVFWFWRRSSNFDNSNFAPSDPLQPILTMLQKRFVLKLRYFQFVW